MQEMTGGKPYFALAFRNDSGGYELRNPLFKGSITSKDITHIRQQGDRVFRVRGFMDYLSFLTIRNRKPGNTDCRQDYRILNSTANNGKAIYGLVCLTMTQGGKRLK